MSWDSKKIIFKTLVWGGIYSALGGLWKILEYMAYGQTIPSNEDTVVAIIITSVIYKLLMKDVTFGD